MKRTGVGIAVALLALTAAAPAAAQSDDDPTGPYPPTSPPFSIEIEAFGTFCLDDTPFVNYDVTPNGFTPTSEQIELRIYDVNGDELPAPYSPMQLGSFTGQFLYPGANDAPPDWPGWIEVPSGSGNWVEDPTDALWRDGLSITVTYYGAPGGTSGLRAPQSFRRAPSALVEQTSEPLVAYADVQYPPATDLCYGPPGVTPPPPPNQTPPGTEPATPVGELPSTGGGFGLVRQGLALLLAGALLAIVATRRRQHQPTNAL